MRDRRDGILYPKVTPWPPVEAPRGMPEIPAEYLEIGPGGQLRAKGSNVHQFPTPQKPAEPPKPAAFPTVAFDECENEPAKDWIVKGVLAAGDESTWFGPPGSGKSALMADLAVHLAAGQEWRGHKIKQARGVVFFALERAALTRRRLRAYRLRDGFKDLPLHVCAETFNVLQPGVVDAIVATVREAEAKMQCSVGLIVMDTWSKLVGATGAEEDGATDIGPVLLALTAVRAALGGAVHIATIGHSGKDPTRRERGSNAKEGHVDMAVQIGGTGDVKTATVVKANDAPEEEITAWKIQSVELGRDSDGDPITAGILAKDVPVNPGSTKAEVTAKQQAALSILERLIADHGQPAPGGAPGRAVTADAWREALFTAGELDRKKPDSARALFSKMRTALATLMLIFDQGGFISMRAAPVPFTVPPPPPPGK